MSAIIPLGPGRHIDIYFRADVMTGEEWARFITTLSTMRDALVSEAPRLVLNVDEGSGKILRQSGIEDDRIIKLGAGGDYGRPLPAMDTVSVTTDLRTPTDAPCVCGHTFGMHHYNGMCASCGNCVKFTEDVGVPE
jgi:hypothetical protein